MIFVGKLVSVQKGDYKSLIVRAERFDYRLKENVVYGESIAIPEELLDLIPKFEKYVDQVICVAVRAIVTKQNKIFLMADSDFMTPEELFDQ